MAQTALDPAEPVTRPVTARFVVSHAEAFATLAAKRGLTVSALIRSLVERELELANTGPPAGG